ncbi:MAG: hypothetical protein AB7P02_05070 [Alphaproteobacteria bacterium]
MTDDLRERVAREIYEQSCLGKALPEVADAILAEIGRTHALVPREPTPEMRKAGADQAFGFDRPRTIHEWSFGDIYRAMLAAAPPLTRTPGATDD